MSMKSKHPLFWIYFSLTTLGFLCSFFSMVLPYWYTRYPQSKNRFVQLGLWEVCFEDFMADRVGNFMFTGCFYLYDSKLKPLWNTVFRAWFVACQAFQTCSFITYITGECMVIVHAVKLISFRGPRAVLIGMTLAAASSMFVLIAVVVMASGVNMESRMKPAASQDWLSDLSQNTLSWSFGLSVISFFPSFFSLILLGWFVYPKRGPGNLLTHSAWEWPTKDDLFCQYHLHDLRSSSKSRSDSPPSKSLISSNPIGSQFDKSSYELRNSNRYPSQHSTTNAYSTTSSWVRAQWNRTDIPNQVHEESSLSADGKLSSYDPRSADTVSLLSYERPPSSFGRQQFADGRTNSIGSSRRSGRGERSRHSSRRSANNRKSPDQSILPELPEPTHHHHHHHSQKSSHRRSFSNADTSVWTTEISGADSSGIYQNTAVQAARPMKRSKSATPNPRSESRSSTPRSDLMINPMNNSETGPPQPVTQVAKPMRRKY